MQLSSLLILAGVILLVLGLIRKIKHLIGLGIIIAVVAVILTGGLEIFGLTFLL